MTVAARVGERHSIGAVLGIAANMFEPGVVEQQIPPSGTWFAIGDDGRTAHAGSRGGRRSPPKRRNGRDQRRHPIVEVDETRREHPRDLPSAILNLPLLKAVEIDGIRPVMDAASREAYRLAIDLGITMRPIFGKRDSDVPRSDQYALDLLDAVLASYSLPDTRVAVLQDWMKGRRAELDAFSGYIVAERARVGGDAPVNAGILELAQRIERGELEPDPRNADLLIDVLEASGSPSEAVSR